MSAGALSKLGWRASDTAELSFDEVFVPREHLLGELDGGFKLIMANFQWERLVMALGAVGAMRRTLERAVAEPAGQAFRHRIADLATRAAAGTALTYHALRRYLDGGDSGPILSSSVPSAMPASARSAAARTRSCGRSWGGRWRNCRGGPRQRCG